MDEPELDAVMELINELTGLQERLLACRTEEDFWLLQGQVRKQWDADVAATKAVVAATLSTSTHKGDRE